jgi:hypothetical protein
MASVYREPCCIARPDPGAFVIETCLRFKPDRNYNFAGLLVYKSDADFIAFGRAFADPASGFPGFGAVGDGLYLDCEKGGFLAHSNHALALPKGTDRVWLRLSRIFVLYGAVGTLGTVLEPLDPNPAFAFGPPFHGRYEVYVADYSLDGCTWKRLGWHVCELGRGVQIGLATFDGNTGNIPDIQPAFEYFAGAALKDYNSFYANSRMCPTTLWDSRDESKFGPGNCADCSRNGGWVWSQ